MSNSFPMVHLRQVLKHRSEFIEIDDFQIYKRCRVQSHAQGIVERDEIPGTEIKTKRQQLCYANEFLVAEIDAKVGGFGIVPSDLDGAIVSSHYFLFTIDDKQMERNFLEFYIRTPHFIEQVRAKGSTNYAAIRPNDVLGYEIPLPPIEEQRRIVARIEELAAKVEEARGLRREGVEETRKFIRFIRSNLLQCKGKTRVSDYATIQSGYAFKSNDLEYSGIRLVRNINISHGYIDWSQVVYISEASLDNYSRFSLSEGDILISLDRPIISTGIKIARVSKKDLPCLLVQRVGKVLFKNDNVLPEYFFEWLKSPYFENAINPGRSNGIPHISPKDIEGLSFSPLSLSEQHSIVEDLNHIQSKLDSLERHQSIIAAELNALLPSILDKAFKGEL